MSDLATAPPSAPPASDLLPAAAPHAHPVPHNVPPALSSFVGRTGERADLARALAGERLVTVTGPGGAGKTRLAREVAAQLAEAGAGAAFPDGVWWVELAPVPAGEAVAPAVAAVLGVRPAPGRDVVDAVAEALRGSAAHPRRALLVLDNCEHVVEEAAVLAERLLRAAPTLTVLATSREALAVEGEKAWVLPPLASPPTPAAGGAGVAASAPPPTADALTGYEAVRLFVDRATSATPTFALTDRTAPAVAAITARLDGLPLALELAAASVGALGVDQVAARLDDAFGLLTRGRRTALPRHRTLRALLDWSYQLLGPAERTLLARLAVFRGPFTLDAAVAVGVAKGADGAAEPGGDPVPDEATAVAALGRLVEQSLVEAGERGGETRFRLLETVRQYGLARLGGHAAAARARHARWAAALAAAAEPAMWGAGRGRTVARLGRDADELRAALDWAAGPLGGAPNTAADPMTAVRLTGALAWFWYSGVPWAEARARTARALAAADAQGVADADRPPAERAALATLLYPVAGMHYFAGEAAPVLAHARRGLALWDAVDAARAADPAVDAELAPAAGRGRSITHQMTGLAHAMLGDGDAAVRAMNASVDAAAAAGEAWLHAVMTMRRGLVHLIVGRGDAAMADYVASVPLLRAAGETWFLSLAVEGMAAVELVRGDLAAAAAHARESIAVLADEPDAWFVSRSLDMLAAIATRAGAPPGPAPTPERAAAAARLLGAAAELRARCGAEVIGHDRERHAAAIATARALLGEAAFAATWAEGEELDLAGAAALAAAADVADPPAAAADAAPPGRAAVPAADGSTLGTQWLGTPAPAAGGGPPALQVLALGPPAVARDGAPLGAGELPAGKATELLLYLVLHPEGRTKEQIGLALWPDASAGQLRGNFHVMLHHVRRALAGPERDAARPWIAYADGRYRLAREAAPGAALDCDVDAVLDAAARLGAAERRGEALDAGALAALGAALARRRGPLGEGLALGAWAAPVAARVGAAWGDAVQALARQHARAGRPAAGAEALAGLVAAEPLREGAHRELMVLWAAAGERARALAHYDELCALLARELGAGPARDTRLVAEAIRRQG